MLRDDGVKENQAQKIDLNIIRKSGLEVIKSPDGHVSIRPYTEAEKKKWIESRYNMLPGDTGYSGNNNTEVVKSARIGKVDTKDYRIKK